jgi:hypothetical protein
MVHKGIDKQGEERVFLVYDKQQEKPRFRPKELYLVWNRLLCKVNPSIYIT